MILRFQVDRRSRALVQKLRRIQREFGGENARMQKAYKACGVECLDDLRVRYLRNASGGGDWQPLKESTLKEKKSRHGILRETDRLYESLFPGAPDNILRVTRAGVSYGSKTPYGKHHQFGTRTIPRRKFLVPPSPAAKAKCKLLLTKAVDDVLKKT